MVKAFLFIYLFILLTVLFHPLPKSPTSPFGLFVKYIQVKEISDESVLYDQRHRMAAA